jgi:8-oxo-dGTP pyrophosphatase MutT (NUDIX family)
MRTETSAGIVLFRNISNENEFLLLNYPQGHWDFIKGKMEKKETPRETALRETKEETGISDIEFIDGFEESVEYDFRFNDEDIHKKVIFFLAKTETLQTVSLSHEHNDYLWLGYNDALKKTTYGNAKNVLSKANELLLSTG